MSRRSLFVPMVLALLGSACGPEVEQVPGPAAPPPPTATVAPSAEPTVTATAAAPVAPKPALADLQREAVKNMIAAFNTHDPKKVASLYSESVVSGSPGPAGWMEDRGRGPIEQGHTFLFGAFPDMKWGSAHVYVKGEVVIQEWVSNATHKGEIGGKKASGKATGIHGVSVYWFEEDGLIKRDDTYYDSATIDKQTGAMPGKARAIPEVPAGEPQWVASSGAAEEGKRVEAAKGMYAAFAGADVKSFLATLDSAVVQRNFGAAEDTKGAKAAEDGFTMLHKAFPDLQVKVTNAWGFGDKVIAQVTMTGTQTGALGPIKASKKSVTLHSLDVLTFGKDDKVTLLESYGSTAELLGQIGALDAAKKGAPAAGAGAKKK